MKKDFLDTCTPEISIGTFKQYSTLAYIGTYTYMHTAYFLCTYVTLTLSTMATLSE